MGHPRPRQYRSGVGVSGVAPRQPHPGDICKCGDSLAEHEMIGPREFPASMSCTTFRLCVTAEEMTEAYDEWAAISGDPS